MMKRYIHILLALMAVALLFSSCVELQTTRTTSNISFLPLIGHDTRAVESVPFPQDRDFTVWAVNQASGDIYIEGETISHSAEGWVSSAIWPLDMMHFEACWPTDLPIEFSPVNGLQLVDFDCSNGDRDILFAKADEDSQDGDVVNLSFGHILSRVEFRMMHSLTDNMQVRLKKIRMIGFASKGDYNTRAYGYWNVREPDHECVIYDAGDTDGIELQAGNAIYVGKEIYVLPQACAAALEVSCEVRYGTANWVPEVETIESLKTHWEPGKHYTYTLNFRMDKLTHTTGISNWNNRED